ncbi:YceI family protein [Parvibaculaceae bacterium PLY_AMNH_Bact1]|nr:YceI family protein [Parvibaculaceae bacterium PLY_AMNH_Bact1]
MVFRSLAILLLFTVNAFASDWEIVAERSKLTFEGTQAGAPFQGSFKDFTTEISLDPTNLQNASIHVDITTASANSGSSERDSALPGADWFDVENHPTASFTSSAVSKTDVGYQAEGTLTIKGSTLPVTLPFSLSIEGDEAAAAGSLTIDRNDFGVGTGPLSPMVGNEVAISFDLVATR